eukprot:29697-Pelagococcus_subviridis.AAC.1
MCKGVSPNPPAAPRWFTHTFPFFVDRNASPSSNAFTTSSCAYATATLRILGEYRAKEVDIAGRGGGVKGHGRDPRRRRRGDAREARPRRRVQVRLARVRVLLRARVALARGQKRAQPRVAGETREVGRGEPLVVRREVRRVDERRARAFDADAVAVDRARVVPEEPQAHGAVPSLRSLVQHAVPVRRRVVALVLAAAAAAAAALNAPHRGVTPERVRRAVRAVALLREPSHDADVPSPARPRERGRALPRPRVYVHPARLHEVLAHVQMAVPRRPMQRGAAVIRPAASLRHRLRVDAAVFDEEAARGKVPAARGPQQRAAAVTIRRRRGVPSVFGDEPP